MAELILNTQPILTEGFYLATQLGTELAPNTALQFSHFDMELLNIQISNLCNTYCELRSKSIILPNIAPIHVPDNSLKLVDSVKENTPSIITAFTTIGGTLVSLISLKIQTSAIFSGEVATNSSAAFCYDRFITYSINTLNVYSEYVSCPVSTIQNTRVFTFIPNSHLNTQDEHFWTYIMYLAIIWFNKSIYLFMALIGWFISFLMRSNNFVNLLKLLSFMSLIKGAGAFTIRRDGPYLFSFLGWFIYILSMGWYDILYKNVKKTHVEKRINLIKNKKLNKSFLIERFLKLGLLFTYVINLGVFFSTYFSNIIINRIDSLAFEILAMLGSTIAAGVSSSFWLALTYPNILGYSWTPVTISLARAFFESVAFNFLSLTNFIIWEWITRGTTNYIAPFIVPLLAYFPISYLQINFENTLGFKSVLYYGLVYVASFTSLSTSSTALYNLMDVGHMSLFPRLSILILSQLFVTGLPLEVYRFTPIIVVNESFDPTMLESLLGTERANSFLIRFAVASLYQLFVFYSFAFGTFIWIGDLDERVVFIY